MFSKSANRNQNTRKTALAMAFAGLIALGGKACGNTSSGSDDGRCSKRQTPAAVLPYLMRTADSSSHPPQPSQATTA